MQLAFDDTLQLLTDVAGFCSAAQLISEGKHALAEALS